MRRGLSWMPGAAAALALAVPAWAQEANTVGDPRLRDFSLPGARPAPPPEREPAPAPTPAPAPAQTAPAPATTAPASRPAPPPAARPVPAPAPGTGPRPAPQLPATAAPSPAASAAPSEPQPSPAPFEATPAPAGAIPQDLPQAAPPSPPAEDLPVEEESAEGTGGWLGGAWLYLLLGLAALGLAGFVWFRRRHEREETVAPKRDSIADMIGVAREAEPAAIPEATPAPVPAPAAIPAAPAPPPAAAVAPPPAEGPRPRLELEFAPDRAVATDSHAEINYALTIRNTGDAVARNIFVEARMFNADARQDQEIGAFFGDPSPERSAVAPRLLGPGDELVFRGTVSMPRESAREVVVKDRRLFIPTVAFNVLYAWGLERTGQTSMSYLVGREAQPPADRMAPFRLDLGPRLYRQVGQRRNRPELVV